MSETTDQIRHWRDRAAQGVVTPLTTVQIIRLCDAAERAETLEDENAELDRKWRAMNGYYEQAVEKLKVALAERDALSAQLTEVTRERDAIQATYDEFCAKFPSKSVMRREAAMRGPADPSAPTPAVTRAQAEQRLTDDFLDGISINADSPSLTRGALIDWLFGSPKDMK